MAVGSGVFQSLTGGLADGVCAGRVARAVSPSGRNLLILRMLTMSGQLNSSAPGPFGLNRKPAAGCLPPSRWNALGEKRNRCRLSVGRHGFMFRALELGPASPHSNNPGGGTP